MFEITALDSLPEGVKLVFRGAQIVYDETPQLFMLRSEAVAGDFRIVVKIKKNPEKQGASVTASPIQNNQLELLIENPHDGLPTSLVKPWDILHIKEPPTQLSFNFTIIKPTGVEHSVIYYEFYERSVVPPISPAPLPN